MEAAKTWEIKAVKAITMKLNKCMLRLGCIVAGLCGPCHVVRRHVIRDVHKYCDAYVLHSQGSFTLQ